MIAMNKRGVFWIVDGKLLAFPFDESATEGIAKSGKTYNHKLLWEHIKPCNTPFDYYPRGRVDWDNQGRPTIYLNPNIDESFINQIKLDFGIRPSDDCRIQYDYSDHYRCHLDDGWKAER